MDEAGIFVESSNCRTGKAFRTVRVNEPGPYSKTEKWNIMMGISGEEGTVQHPSRRWRILWLEGGTIIQRIIDFIQIVLDDIGPLVC